MFADLLLALSLAAAGPRARPAEATADNASRARHGLLPRKAPKARPALAARRAVFRPPSPTWLGEPGGTTEAAPGLAVAPAPEAPAPAEERAEPAPALAVRPARVAEPARAVVAVVTGPAPVAGVPELVAPAGPALSGAVDGAEVALVLLHRGAAPARALELAVAAPEVELVLRRAR